MRLASLLRRAAGPLALSVAAAVLTPSVARADLTFTLGGADFSGGTDNIGGTITVLIHDVSSGVVNLTITNNLLDAAAYLDQLNLNTTAAPLASPAGSCVSCLAINNVAPGFQFGSNSLFADGGGAYDIELDFNSALADRLTPGESVTLQLSDGTNSAFNAASFNSIAAPHGGAGPFVIAGHVAGLNNQGSDWLTTTTTPEPSSMILMATGLAGLVARRRKIKSDAV